MFMETFKSSINNRSASFKSNKKAMLNLIDELNNYLNKTKILGSEIALDRACLLYTSPSPRDNTLSRMPSSA